MTIIHETCEKGLLILIWKYTVVLLTQLYDMFFCKYTITNVTTLQKFEFKSDKFNVPTSSVLRKTKTKQ